MSLVPKMVYDRNKLPIYQSFFVARDQFTDGSTTKEIQMGLRRKKSKIAAVQTAFPFGGTINPPNTKNSASKGTCCRHSCNFGFLLCRLYYSTVPSQKYLDKRYFNVDRLFF